MNNAKNATVGDESPIAGAAELDESALDTISGGRTEYVEEEGIIVGFRAPPPATGQVANGRPARNG